MKKILNLAFVAVMLVSGTVFAQSANSDCQNRLKRAKQAYRDLGAKKAQPLFDQIIKNCDKPARGCSNRRTRKPKPNAKSRKRNAADANKSKQGRKNCNVTAGHSPKTLKHSR